MDSSEDPDGNDSDEMGLCRCDLEGMGLAVIVDENVDRTWSEASPFSYPTSSRPKRRDGCTTSSVSLLFLLLIRTRVSSRTLGTEDAFLPDPQPASMLPLEATSSTTSAAGTTRCVGTPTSLWPVAGMERWR